jgi:hypothetical protein
MIFVFVHIVFVDLLGVMQKVSQTVLFGEHSQHVGSHMLHVILNIVCFDALGEGLVIVDEVNESCDVLFMLVPDGNVEYRVSIRLVLMHYIDAFLLILLKTDQVQSYLEVALVSSHLERSRPVYASEE